MSINIRERKKEAKEHSRKCIKMLGEQLESVVDHQIKTIKNLEELPSIHFQTAMEKVTQESLMRMSESIHRINKMIQAHSKGI